MEWCFCSTGCPLYLTHICRDVQEDGVSEAKDDPKMEEQIVGNRNDSTGMDLPKKPGFDLFHNASGLSQSLTSEVDLKAKALIFCIYCWLIYCPFVFSWCASSAFPFEYSESFVCLRSNYTNWVSAFLFNISTGTVYCQNSFEDKIDVH